MGSVSLDAEVRDRFWRRQTRRLDVGGALSGIAIAFLVVLVAAGLLAPLIAPSNPNAQNLLASSLPPGHGHLLGTDQLGRDVFSRLIAGIRPALVGPFCVAALCLVIGCPIGMLAAYKGGFWDGVITRFADLIYTLPGLLVAVVVVGILGGGYWLTVAIFAFLSIPYQIRLSRSATLVQVRLPYIDAARTLGLSTPRTLVRHVLPNILPTALTTFLLDLVGSFVGFASLAYLGIGVQPGSVSWGVMIADGQALLSQNPWAAIAPAIALMITASCITLAGDRVHERIG